MCRTLLSLENWHFLSSFEIIEDHENNDFEEKKVKIKTACVLKNLFPSKYNFDILSRDRNGLT